MLSLRGSCPFTFLTELAPALLQLSRIFPVHIHISTLANLTLP